MKRLLLILVIIPFLTYAQSGDKNFIDQNYMEVTGKSEMSVIPDLIYIQIIINEKDNKNKTALADRESAMIKKLNEIGIDTKKDLQIRDMASNFKNYWLAKEEILLSKQYQVLVRDGRTAGRVFVELERLGISNVAIDKLDNSQMQAHRREVKVDAVKAAKEKAEAMASALGQSVGRAIYIQEIEGMFPIVSASNSIRFDAAVSRGPEPEIDFEKLRLEYSVLCRFELK